ncbi:MAG: Gfo/Idh/MocA family oxidoreductase [Lautropia sp.]|nr:Gfo/Idh/MocA family oxidoreductase [Lautropia sp.]
MVATDKLIVPADRKIRVALVGCGRISANHFQAIERHAAEAELVDVCDINPEALKAAVERTGAKGHGTLDAMLEKTTADIVVLTTPSGLHATQAIQVAESGRHVISEKPMATRWKDGLAMNQACQRAGVHLFVVKQNRKNATLQALRHAIQQGRFGKIYMAVINVFWTRPQEYYDAAPWRGTWALDGGAFMNQASHYVDLLDWMIGPVDRVHAFTGTLARNIEAEDSGVMSVRWKNGALGSINVTMLTYPKNLEGSIIVLGERGTVKVGGVAVNEITHWEFADKRPEDELILSSNYEPTSVYGFGHPLYYHNVMEVLRGRARPETDGNQGLRSLALLSAAYRSAWEGREVAIDEFRQDAVVSV